MPVEVKSLKPNSIYYTVGLTPYPEGKSHLQVSSWVYISQKGEEYSFCDWWEYFRNYIYEKTPEKARHVLRRAELNPETKAYEITTLFEAREMLTQATEALHDLELDPG